MVVWKETSNYRKLLTFPFRRVTDDDDDDDDADRPLYGTTANRLPIEEFTMDFVIVASTCRG